MRGFESKNPGRLLAKYQKGSVRVNAYRLYQIARYFRVEIDAITEFDADKLMMAASFRRAQRDAQGIKSARRRKEFEFA